MEPEPGPYLIPGRLARPDRVEVAYINRARIVWWQFLLGVGAWFLVFLQAAKTVEVTDATQKSIAGAKADLQTFKAELSSSVLAVARKRLAISVLIARKVGVPEEEIREATGASDLPDP